ncbi:tRNA pseudouridine(55) synthase TruB [Hwanghaeella sp.]|uniref:tRNA pseudouridine(55) synthase TruB n=1 Tax=Hwanghaeella sp. TaxID=2605943 RepID=UPI003CCBCCA0
MGRKRKGNPVHGWVIVDKPAGIGSTPVVGKVRRYFNAQKAGHGGTLDPFASGVLPIALGEATKTMAHIVDGLKTYEFTVAWGTETDTLDIDGEVTATSPVRPTREEIEAALPGFIGTIEQIPPAFSAIKVDGQRAYDLARSGEQPELAPREVEVIDLDLIDMPDADHARFTMTCGKGTYVRAIGRDLAKKLGTVAHISLLRRTRVGPFRAENAVPLAEFDLDSGENTSFSLEALGENAHKAARQRHLLPLQAALDGIPAIALSEAEAMRLRNGQAVSLLRKLDLERVSGIGPGEIALATTADRALALVRFEKGALHPVRVFNL